MSFPTLTILDSIDAALDGTFDALLLIKPATIESGHQQLDQLIAERGRHDQRIGKQAMTLHAETMPGNKLIYAPCGPLDRDYDDVRRFGDAARSAIDAARAAGCSRVAMAVYAPQNATYQQAAEVAYLAACQELWQPLEAREALGEVETEPVASIALFSNQKTPDSQLLQAIEAGRRVARDLCGTEPERMAPPRFAEYCQQEIGGAAVEVSVIDDIARLRREYPLLSAVARASIQVERHQPRVIRLHYRGSGDIKQRLYFAGKGLVYDTGGADLKVGGHMAGMSRDKGGGAAVAGFMKTLAEWRPEGIEVVAEIGAVRNSIGEESFVSDEIIRSHAGVRVRIGNTDAEGRLVLADILSHLRSEAAQHAGSQLFSIATLTGHAALAMGPYSAFVQNGPAEQQGIGNSLEQNGDRWGDPGQVSRSRREDFDFVKPRTRADDVLSSNNAPSSGTPRGHQFPFAFLAIASGLDKHGASSDQPLAYTHIDIAGSGVESGDWQHGKPTAAPVATLAATYLL
ncbi:MAG: peptidase M17 [Wenzhouxiangellaceae bacterium]